MHACMHDCQLCLHLMCMVLVKVLLACRLHLWPGGNIEDRLKNAFQSFDSWRRVRRLSTSITKFELKTFKCTSCLGVRDRMKGGVNIAIFAFLGCQLWKVVISQGFQIGPAFRAKAMTHQPCVGGCFMWSVVLMLVWWPKSIPVAFNVSLNDGVQSFWPKRLPCEL